MTDDRTGQGRRRPAPAHARGDSLWPWVGLVLWRTAVAMAVAATILHLSIVDATTTSPDEIRLGDR